MDWDHLRIVLAVRQKGSMHAAAQALGIDRATVLRRLGAIEAQLGASLFDRRRDGCTPTPAGLGIIETLEGVAETLTVLEGSVRVLPGPPKSGRDVGAGVAVLEAPCALSSRRSLRAARLLA